MRILHTADWHLGRLFYNEHLTEDQRYTIEHSFFSILEQEKIDVVVISGDVFDRSVPPVEAIQLWESVLKKLAFSYQVPTIVISGNHDSGPRLAAGHAAWKSHGIYILGHMKGAMEPIVLQDSTGPIEFWGIPYGEVGDIRYALGLEEVNLSIGDAYEAWADHVRRHSTTPRRVAIAHAFVVGGSESESERPLSVGGSSQVPTSVFKDFHYTALGHLHRPQQMGVPTIRYSGSLLPYAFDEAGYDKTMTIVDMDATGECTVKEIPLQLRSKLVTITGLFEDLLVNVELQELHRDDYVEVHLLDTAPVIDGMRRLRKVFPKCMRLELVGRQEYVTKVTGSHRFKALEEEALFDQFVTEARKSGLTEEEKQYINGIWDRIQKEELS